MKGKSKIGINLAVAAAANLSLIGCHSHVESSKQSVSQPVQCYGINSCKGMTDCKTTHNNCRGQNACKGMGWLAMSKMECAKSGGTSDE